MSILVQVWSGDVLFLASMLSHKRSLLPAAQALGARGHKVTFWAADVLDTSLKTPNIAEDLTYLVEVDDKDFMDGHKYHNNTNFNKILWELRGTPPIGMVFPWSEMSKMCEEVSKNHREELEKIANRHWDLIVFDPHFTLCAFPIVKMSGAPYLIMSTSMDYPATIKARGIPAPTSYYPQTHIAENFDIQSFFERLWNCVGSWIADMTDLVIERKIVRPRLHGLYDDFTFEEFHRQALIGINTFPQDFDYVKPGMPDLVSLFNTCPKAKPLPADYQEFVEDPNSKGTILLSFGHMVKWSAAADWQLAAVEAALDRLSDYRIIWQCDVPDLSEKNSTRPHIRRVHWLPQTDLLYHSKTRAFVSHGGLKSVLESVCAKVPFVALPQFAEQFRNAGIIRAKNLGVFLDKFKLTSDLVYDTIREAIENPVYKSAADHYGQMVKDKPIGAHEYAAFVLEYALKHNERLHFLHTRSVNLSFIQLYSLDILTILITFVAAVLIGLFKLILWLAKTYFWTPTRGFKQD